jgi:hypothetical protein
VLYEGLDASKLSYNIKRRRTHTNSREFAMSAHRAPRVRRLAGLGRLSLNPVRLLTAVAKHHRVCTVLWLTLLLACAWLGLRWNEMAYSLWNGGSLSRPLGLLIVGMSGAALAAIIFLWFWPKHWSRVAQCMIALNMMTLGTLIFFGGMQLVELWGLSDAVSSVRQLFA